MFVSMYSIVCLPMIVVIIIVVGFFFSLAKKREEFLIQKLISFSCWGFEDLRINLSDTFFSEFVRRFIT